MKNNIKTALITVFCIAISLVFVQCNNTVKTDKQTSHKPIIPPKPRLQMDIATGSPDLQWWRDAKTTRDQRLEDWRDARFGCFIHWNASALLGSNWKGKAYRGYGEHIQRMAKIPCEEYRRDVVGKFNPTEFNADAWANTIRKAGMRYVIITAKHHDGFAVYNSDASDYNMLKATPFGRDPMAELKAACDKNGLDFGFYYSHAFDWGEPNGPGNDWDYKNPGGDKHLFASKKTKWFDEHPEIAPRIRKYVDEKSIPQVLELIKKYDPDFLWFDTPHKLPPEENLRIMEAARAAKPSIVINSRGVQGYDGGPDHFGDYESTGDRAVDFPTKDGDWEAIPTTNESYGYSESDRSHKTPEYLVRVLVKAVARGGNMLLNIGPKGDGLIDGADINILEGIGQWMDVNEASIRGTVRTTLPVQAWGESTRKKNTFYLHVFDWPTNGVLQLGGFLGKVNKAWLLSDKNQIALSLKRTDNMTVQFEIPSKAPDAASSVIVVEVDDAKNVDSHRLISTSQDNTLRAFDGIAVGGEFKYGNGKSTNNGVSGWKNSDQAITWPIYLSEAGKFKVIAEYKPYKQSNKFVVEVGGATLSDNTKTNEKGYIKHDLGNMDLSSGNQIIKIHADGIPEGDIMELRALHFTPISEK
ncbi:alpha-L-fucosidase [Flavivirga jejuensis]|uniref:alpha-L-fucosidase n=1 Tax=Flavivirga jejuensis TaxID=870487 RepID=A0ABT8WP70_9FLAO|nr:alpha-L-fucosidase [Flavivirga jejuensis]MDO5974960.1 alpha-L-fucosidase [Flavivirga jejuensis]